MRKPSLLPPWRLVVPLIRVVAAPVFELAVAVKDKCMQSINARVRMKRDSLCDTPTW